MARRWVDAAELVASQGLKGRLVARSAHGLPFLLEEGMTVHFVPPTLEGPREAVVRFAGQDSSAHHLVEFDGVGSVEVAQRLVGSHCLVARADLPEGFERGGDAWLAGLIGLAVVDESCGYVGDIVDVQDMPTQHLLVVEREGGEEALVPLVDDFIAGVDEQAGELRMNLPAGLLDPIDPM